MPIAVRCKCGHSMNVPDSAAGKVGKCPKCQQPIKVPATAAAPTQAPAVKQKSGAPVQQKVAAASSAMDKVLTDAGIGVPKGPTCPSCDQPVLPNSAICTHCGYHFERGERMAGHQLLEASSQFDNLYLDEAAKNIVLDREAEARVTYSGAPWWVILAIVLALLIMIVAGVSKIQAFNTEKFAPKGSILRPMQKMSFVVLIAYIGMVIGGMVFVMSYLAVAASAFKESIGKGFMGLFIPFYTHYYAIVNRKRLHTTTTVHLIWTALFAAFAIWFFANNGLRFFKY